MLAQFPYPKILIPQFCFTEELRRAGCGDPEQVHTPKFYWRYINSDVWYVIRKLALEHYGWKCSLCGCRKKLEIHHITYAHKFDERLKDLVILCSDCHMEEHGFSDQDGEQVDWLRIAA